MSLTTNSFSVAVAERLGKSKWPPSPQSLWGLARNFQNCKPSRCVSAQGLSGGQGQES